MFRVRPVQTQDLGALLALAQQASIGMTSLMADETVLAKVIEDAITCFDKPEPIRKNTRFLWVLEDVDTKQVIGCTAVKPSIGGDSPFYSIMHQHQRVHSASAGITREDEWLISDSHFPAASELATLYLAKTYRKHNLAVLLSYARLLFMANFPNYFHSLLIAEVRGVFEEDGNSPFWEGLGRHFFHMDFSEADKLCWQKGTDFIKELMPKAPILQALLPLSAQRVIGHANQDSVGALKLLQRQGLALSPYIDMFDGGPLIWADTAHMAIIKTSVSAKVNIGEVKLDKACWLVRHATIRGATMYIAGELAHQHPRAVLTIDAATAEALGVVNGDDVRVYAIGDLDA